MSDDLDDLGIDDARGAGRDERFIRDAAARPIDRHGQVQKRRPAGVGGFRLARLGGGEDRSMHQNSPSCRCAAIAVCANSRPRRRVPRYN
jgi:hypothetical protein